MASPWFDLPCHDFPGRSLVEPADRFPEDHVLEMFVATALVSFNAAIDGIVVELLTSPQSRRKPLKFSDHSVRARA